MNKRVTFIYGKRQGDIAYNAGSKAVSDVNQILTQMGFVTRVLRTAYGGSFFARIIAEFCRFITTISAVFFSEIVVFQFLFEHLERFQGIKQFLYRHSPALKIAIVHDLEYLREGYDEEGGALKYLKVMDFLIVHTPAMKSHLISKGFSASKMKVLYAFDYLTDTKNLQERGRDGEVVYAGNLEKSPFLEGLKNLSFPHTSFNLYGASVSQSICGINIHYIGKFQPDDVSNIKGGWGLVWDGNSCDTCEGATGWYLMYNSPHKVSLYIAAELPIIIWKGAALADFIVENHLGITIDSLSELETAIDGVLESQYESFRAALKKESEVIIRGERLTHIIKEMIN